MKAIYNGMVIAESQHTKEVEGNYYFPAHEVNKDFIEKSETHSTCPWKGEASYYHVKVNGKVEQDAAWYYPDPKDAAKDIKNYVAFWKGVEIKD